MSKRSLEQLSLLVMEENWRKQDSVQEPSRQPARSPGSLDRVPMDTIGPVWGTAPQAGWLPGAS